ncbi:MAG: hypothetical protein KDC87_12725 [Planctomycetes bacterium]|nr:hypothetical protein [Planctomycetota bacterium]
MLTLAVSLVLFQRLDPPKRVAYPGEEIEVRAVDRAGAPLGGIAVDVVHPDGRREPLRADGQGRVRYRAAAPSALEFHMQVPEGPLVIATYRVVRPPRRWLYALLLTPLGLVLLWANLRKSVRRGDPGASD